MTSLVEETLRQVLIRNIIAFADDAVEYGIGEDEQMEMYALADRLDSRTATDSDWIEAISHIDVAG